MQWPALRLPQHWYPKNPDGIRLNKYIANSGVCSRREADTFIATGLVSVNGKIVNQMGYKVQLEDDVRFDGRRINPEPETYILLNKPKGVATTTSEQKGLTVMDLISNATSARVKPVGRLGRNATGLLLFTNDDSLVDKLHSKGMERLFHIELDKNLKHEDLEKISEDMSDIITVGKINVEEQPNISSNPLAVRALPSFFLYVDGKMKASRVGATDPETMKQWIKDNLI